MSRKKTWDKSKHFLTPLQTAQLLNLSEESIYRRLASRELIGLKMGRSWRIPTAQFKSDRIKAARDAQSNAPK